MEAGKEVILHTEVYNSQKLTVVFCLLLFINQSSWAREITVKYRDSPVDVSSGFIEYALIDSSFVNELFYCKRGQTPLKFWS